jgi:hypothetical protein
MFGLPPRESAPVKACWREGGELHANWILFTSPLYLPSLQASVLTLYVHVHVNDLELVRASVGSHHIITTSHCGRWSWWTSRSLMDVEKSWSRSLQRNEISIIDILKTQESAKNTQITYFCGRYIAPLWVLTRIARTFLDVKFNSASNAPSLKAVAVAVSEIWPFKKSWKKHFFYLCFFCRIFRNIWFFSIRFQMHSYVSN